MTVSALPPPPPPPPSGPAVGTRPTPTAQPLLVRARLAQVAIGIQIVFAGFSSRALWNRADLVRRFERRVGTGLDALDSADLRVVITNLLHLATYLVAGVIFLLWFHAAYRNLAARQPTKHTTGWALGSWFIPVLALWRPATITEELLGPRPPLGMRLLPWGWWILWVLSMFVWSLTIWMVPADFDGFVALDRWAATGQAAHIVAGVLTIVLVRHITGLDDAARVAADGEERSPT